MNLQLVYSPPIEVSAFNPISEPLSEKEALPYFEVAKQLMDEENLEGLKRLGHTAVDLSTGKGRAVLGVLVYNPELQRVEIVSIQRVIDLPEVLGRFPDLGDDLYEILWDIALRSNP